MKIKLVSDLHLEFSDINIQNDADYDVLILAGDIMIAQPLHDHPDIHKFRPEDPNTIWKLGTNQEMSVRFHDFFKRVSFQFPHVIYIMGNHEFYDGKWMASIDYMRTVCAEFPNIHMLERDTVTIDDVVFVGGTLWTDMNKGDPLTMHAIRDMMNDYRSIRHDMAGYRTLKPSDTVERHRQTVGYIKHVLDENKDKRCVVVGHHSPSFLSCSDYYKHDTLMNGGYHSNLEEFILDHEQIVLWVHGHTHHPFDYYIGSTRVVCNPRGYQSGNYDEATGWNPNIVLEV
jgi:Icc-related predicted phosphoesterase